MGVLFIDSFSKLKHYCEAEGFKGWDPYDGLNSKVFQAIPLASRSAFLRLVVIQGFKRCPVNLRRLALVPKEYNAKGIALFLSGYCRLYQALKLHPELESQLGSADEACNKIVELADLLLSLRSKGDYHGSCWGYNFDWQARLMFYFPKFTPTVVATTFAASSLFEAYDIIGDKKYLDAALSSAEFVLHDLRRTPVEDKGYTFSYSPLKNNDSVINATLLGCKLLAMAYERTGREEYRDVARGGVEACCSVQREDGAWRYGLTEVQSWVDSFHTGYNLDALSVYQRCTGDHDFSDNIARGLDYYLKNFFEPDGSPKYYDNRQYPIDIHCPGQLPVTLDSLGCFEEHRELVGRVYAWTMKNMQDPKGYFYYQLKQGWSSKISYMRWSNAFMFHALATVILH